MTKGHIILIVDDHGIFRSGLNKLLAETGEFSTIAEAASITEATSFLEMEKQSVTAILDINLAGQNALEQIPVLKQAKSDLLILVMSMYSPDQFATAAAKAGANGYLTKDASTEELLEAVRLVSKGENYRFKSPDQQHKSKSKTDPLAGYLHERLSTRELEILKLIANGESLTDIGKKVFLSVKTVSTYRSRILEKLDLNNNAELIKYALTHGLTLTKF